VIVALCAESNVIQTPRFRGRFAIFVLRAKVTWTRWRWVQSTTNHSPPPFAGIRENNREFVKIDPHPSLANARRAQFCGTFWPMCRVQIREFETTDQGPPLPDQGLADPSAGTAGPRRRRPLLKRLIENVQGGKADSQRSWYVTSAGRADSRTTRAPTTNTSPPDWHI